LENTLYKYIIKELIRGYKILLSHYINPKLVIITNIARYKRDYLLIIDEKQLLSKTRLIDYIPDKILLANKTIEGVDVDSIIYIEPTSFPWRENRANVLVTLTPGNYNYKPPRYYEKIYLTRINENLYELRFKKTMEKYRFRIKGLKLLFIERPSGLTGKAYDIITHAMIEYGELTIKDTIRLLVSELGIDKEEAKRILSKLLTEKYIRVEKKRIYL